MSKQGCRDVLKVLGVVVAIPLVIGLCNAITGNAPAPERTAKPAAQGEPTRMRMPTSEVAGKGSEAQSLQRSADSINACQWLADLTSRLNQDAATAGQVEFGEEKFYASPVWAGMMLSERPEWVKEDLLLAVKRCYGDTGAAGGNAIWSIKTRNQVLLEPLP